MNEEETARAAKSEMNSIVRSLPLEIRWIIGCMLVFFLFIGGMQFISNTDNFSFKDCWTMEYHDGRMFKFNSCDGEIIEIDPKTLKKISQ